MKCLCVDEHIIEGVRVKVAHMKDGTHCARIDCPDATFQATFSNDGKVLVLGWAEMEPIVRDAQPPTPEMLRLMTVAVITGFGSSPRGWLNGTSSENASSEPAD